MKIRTKVLIYLISSLLIGAVIAIFAVANLSITYIHNEEDLKIQKNLSNSNSLLFAKFDVVESVLIDWAQWDDTYSFMEQTNDSYIQSNLAVETLENLDLDGMIFIDPQYNISYDVYTETARNENLSAVFSEQEALSGLIDSITSTTNHYGITVINNRLFLVSAGGITNSSGTAPVNGYLILIQELGDEFFTQVNELLKSDISYYETSEIKSILSEEQLLLENYERNDLNLIATAYITDILNNQTIYFESSSRRDSFINAVNTLRTVSISIFGVFILIIFVSIFSLDHIVIKRLSKLNDFVNKVIKSNDTNLRIEPTQDDEITHLTDNINLMLERLNQSFNKLSENDKRLHLLMDATNDGYLDYDLQSDYITFSSSFLENLGYHDNLTKIKFSDFEKYFHQDDLDNYLQRLQDYFDSSQGPFREEVRIKKADGNFAWILIRGKSVDFDFSKKPTRFLASLSDITEEKNTEQEKIFLLQTDPVTRLKNRLFMETIIQSIEENKEMNYCIIMIDINGLKLTNDAFGHKEGDRLLRIVGNIIRESCSESDTPVRWGGDEFLILIKNNREYAQKLIRKIRFLMKDYQDFPICISASIGLAGRRPSDPNIDQVIKRAEDRMYHVKIAERKQVRSEIFTALSERLTSEIIVKKKQHQLFRQKALALGKKLSLSAKDLDRLSLLCDYYEIGKLTLSKNIMTKQFHELTKEEWSIFKIHPESGYQMAKMLPELETIADEILNVYEYYDGSGFPNGHQKNQIPLLSRIVLLIIIYFTLLEEFNGDIQMTLEKLKTLSKRQLDPKLTELFISLEEKNNQLKSR